MADKAITRSELVDILRDVIYDMDGLVLNMPAGGVSPQHVRGLVNGALERLVEKLEDKLYED